MTDEPTIRTFTYEAQLADGRPFTGTLDAPDADAARGRLATLGLRVIRFEAEATDRRSRPIGGSDFAAFNQQLAHLTQAGLPLEHSLRLVAHDMRTGPLARTVWQIANDLEKGMPIGEAFDARRGKFPPLYGKLMDAGIKSGRLPGMLFNLSRHVEFIQRLRAILWQIMAYPLIMLVMLMVLLFFIGYAIAPQFLQLFYEFHVPLPSLTVLIMRILPWMPHFAVGVLTALVVGAVVWRRMRTTRAGAAVIDALVLPIPVLGAAVRWSLVSRWCDAMRMGVDAGLTLPAALTLAGDAVGSPALQRDSAAIAATVEAGQPVINVSERAKLTLPVTIPAAIELAGERHALAETLESLTRMYEKQAELRAAAISAVLLPMMLIIVGGTMLFIVVGMMLPLVKLIRNLT